MTFAYPKLGHFAFPGAAACGQLVVANIGTDPKLADDIASQVADAEMVRVLLPARPADAHKGTFGKLLVIAHEWQPREAWEHSMALLKEQVPVDLL